MLKNEDKAGRIESKLLKWEYWKDNVENKHQKAYLSTIKFSKRK
jgi:hypothetical protein